MQGGHERYVNPGAHGVLIIVALAFSHPSLLDLLNSRGA